jgi:hypothetical protein
MAIPFNPMRTLPPEPWEQRAYYLVSVSFRPGNPWHHAILYTGFLDNKGFPCGYSGLFNPSYEPAFMEFDHSHELRIIVVRKIEGLEEMK